MCEKPGVANQGPGDKPFLFGRVCRHFPGGGEHPHAPSFLSEGGEQGLGSRPVAGTCLSLPAGGGTGSAAQQGAPAPPPRGSSLVFPPLGSRSWAPGLPHTGPPGPPSPSYIIFAVSLQGPPFFWLPGLMPGQLFRRPSPSTILLKCFPRWSWEHTVPAKGRGPRVWLQPCGGP